MRFLVVFADALGPSQGARLARRLPWLTSTRGLRGELGYSSGALATILTGRPPAEHGRMCLFSAHQAAGASPLSPLRWMGLLPRKIHERGPVRRLLARVFARAQGWSGYFALHRVPPEAFRWLDVPERDDIFNAPDLGGAPTFLEIARRRGLRVLSARWQLGEGPRWSEALEALARDTPDLTFLYSSELDGALHAEGSQGAGVDRALDRLAERVDAARTRLLGEGPLTTLLVGDHGMADVGAVLDPAPLSSLPGRYFVDSTMARFWGEGPALARARAICDRWPGRWLDTSALTGLGAPVAGAPYGEAMFVLDEGLIFAPSFVGGACLGMHGYEPSAASASASVASDRALPELASLRDVAPFVLEGLVS